ncbi:MAG: hypothetical protein NZ518_12035, partial [Dehalococcoidia bacterium]|nr:hypothetical protein [Dehalococcoidia bacterium]
MTMDETITHLQTVVRALNVYRGILENPVGRALRGLAEAPSNERHGPTRALHLAVVERVELRPGPVV